MAIRINASGDYARRTANLPSDTTFTICGWALIIANPDEFAVLVEIADNVTNAAHNKMIGWETDGELLGAGGEAAYNTFASSPAVGDWFYWALSCEGGGANQVHGYWRPAAGGVTYTADGESPAFTEAVLYLGRDSYAEWLDCRLANVIVYDAVLTQTEIEAQQFMYIPIRRTNIHAWWPMFGGATERLRDYSGNAKTLTAGGTLTDEGGPPITWGLWTPPRYTSVLSAQSIDLDALTLVSSIPDLTITAGLVSILLDALSLTSTIEDISISGVVSILLDALLLTGNIDDIIVSGTVSVLLDALTLAGTVENLTLSGLVSILLDTLTLAGSVEDLTLSGAVSILLDVLMLAGSVEDLTLSGTVSILLDALTLAGTIEDVTVSGLVSILLDTLTLAGSVDDLIITGGAVSILLDALTLAGSIEDVSVSLTISILLDALILAGTIPNLTVLPGGVTINLDNLTLASSLPDLIITALTAIVALTLLKRSNSLTMNDRDIALALIGRLDTLSLADRDIDLTLRNRSVSLKG